METEQTTRVETYKFEPIKGYPMLNWRGKRTFEGTQFYPAQLKEVYGQPEETDWMNKIFWGDNLQVMSHLLKEYRGKVKLVYIDPPFDSKAQYKKSIKLRGKITENDQSIFEEKQYNDIWANDDYLQFLYERLILIKELMAEDGALYLHCDWHKSHYIRLILDEIFGADNFRNEIIWVRSTNPKGSQHESRSFSHFTDTIYYYVKSTKAKLYLDRIRKPLTEEEINEKYHRIDEKGRFYDAPILCSDGMGARPNLVYEYKGFTPGPSGWRMKRESLERLDKEGNLGWSKTGKPFRKLRPESDKGKPVGSFWDDISLINSQAEERLGYPTQKPEKLLERILRASSDPGDIIFDCFMGSGTTQAVAMKLGRKFIGADINLGSIQTTTQRLLNVINDLKESSLKNEQLSFIDNDEDANKIESFIKQNANFSVYNVNHYDIFRNPAQAKELLIEALEIQPLESNSLYDGELDGYMVKIMPINRIATKADLEYLIKNFDYKLFEKRKAENPNQPVERLKLVCMGHEPNLKGSLLKEIDYKLDVEIVDILRDKKELQFKREAEADIQIEDGKLIIKSFYPMNLLQKLSLLEENVGDWRELVESIMVDWNYDGSILEPTVVDVPNKNELVKGVYEIPKSAGTIKVKLTDLISESLEVEIDND
ncbi:Type III restriction-modification system methylation subunit [Bacillus mycoides]|uniref:site-specific DNA-methyltransferase n=1 Tax=Bacillus mycoides TaxID=1405 RepID=UPI000A27B911|nr:site-specific DNA-methyltransferase [Bacillus mycoides]OSY16407.1 Type III restriction-modification system methylation subunit [Bacillus mycoides]